MKKSIILLSLLAFCINCFAQSNRVIQNEDILFEFEKSNWHVQNHRAVLDILKEYRQEEQFTEEEMVAVFTYDKLPAYNLPAFQIINRKTDMAPLLMERFEKEHGLFSENELEHSQSVNLDFFKPTIIKSKRLILMETITEMHENIALKIRQAIFCLDHNLIIVQFAYLNERDTKYIEEFNQIVNSLRFQ